MLKVNGNLIDIPKGNVKTNRRSRVTHLYEQSLSRTVGFTMLRLSKSQSYSVPVVERTLDILEVLYGSHCPLKTNEISSKAEVSRSTTYRILRTLVQRGYVLQNLDGEFSVKHLDSNKIVLIGREDQSRALMRTEPESNLSTDQLIEILLMLLQNLRSGSPGPSAVDKMTLPQSANAALK
jgi:hypothetical protein